MSRTEAALPGARRAAERHQARGHETRLRVLDAAFALAAKEGLEALTIGRLAAVAELSKAGLFGHFGSKEDLQIATVDFARSRFVAEVVTPALAEAAGLPRLVALTDRWLAYSDVDGGCFFAAASAEFDSRPGPVRDRIAAVMTEWLRALERAVADATRHGHIRPDVDAEQVAFELHALVAASNWAMQLFGDRRSLTRARRGVAARLDAIMTDEGRDSRAG